MMPDMTEDEVLAALRQRVVDARPTDDPHFFELGQPVSEEAIDAAQRAIGYPLPPLLRRIYREIANGGVGPFGGIEPLPGGYSFDDTNIVDMYLGCREAELAGDVPPPPPAGVLFLCDFGCAMRALLDCRHPDGQMWWWEEGNRHKLDLTFPAWLSAWLRGDLDRVHRAPELILADESWYRPER
jgi:hypothetical protein